MSSLPASLPGTLLSAVPSATPPSQSASARKSSSLPNTPAAHKLQQAAAEFESILLSSLWKSMKGSFASEDGDSTDPAHDTLDGLGVQSLCAAVAKSGGLGLGRLILNHLQPMLSNSQTQSPPNAGK